MMEKIQTGIAGEKSLKMMDNLTKFNQKKKLWMTPKHPLYAKSKQYRMLYGAVVFMQAELNLLVSPLNNFEVQRLLSAGFHLRPENMAEVLRLSKDKGRVLDELMEEFTTERERYLILLDLINVSLQDGELGEKQMESLQLFRKMFQVSSKEQALLMEFAKRAAEEQVAECRELLHRMHIQGMELSPVDMKYYIMRLWDTILCTQEMLEEEMEVRIVERCQITEDLVLYPGMRLIFDHAQVRIHGNILLLGGELIIEESKIIRKGDSHRACINMKDIHSRIVVDNSEVDCRSLGMFIRAEAGELTVKGSSVYHTTRGAAIRFWGNSIEVRDSVFYDCYSHEDGGAMMIRTPNAVVSHCTFRKCEAKKGGAIFAVEGNEITRCIFRECVVAGYGAAVYYHGLVRARVHDLTYDHCYPEGVETVQYLSRMSTFQIVGEYPIRVSTIIDCPIIVEADGNLTIEDANVYLNYPIRCRGSIQMKNVKLISSHLQDGDMLILEHSRSCHIKHCEFNGMGKTGGIYASGTRMKVTESLFRNIAWGRAIYDAYAPEIRECIFNFCEEGAVYAQNGEIERCIFVNCRAKSGAGILMYGGRGRIERCNFRRCITDFSGGAIDRTLGQQVIKCHYEDCKPDNVS